MTPTSTVATIIAAIVTITGGWLAARKPGTRENFLIDQLQEQLNHEVEKRGKLDAKVDQLYRDLGQLRDQIMALRITEMAWQAYYADLHSRWLVHRQADRAPVIAQMAPPPPGDQESTN